MLSAYCEIINDGRKMKHKVGKAGEEMTVNHQC